MVSTEMALAQILEATDRRWPLMLTECGLNSANMERGSAGQLSKDDYLRGRFVRAQQEALMRRSEVFASIVYTSGSEASLDDNGVGNDWSFAKYDGNAKPSLGGYMNIPRTSLFPDGFENSGEVVSPYPSDFPG